MYLTEVMAFLVLPFYVAAQIYMLESQPSYLSEVKVCPVTVNITCRADRVLVLRWIAEQDLTLVEFASHSGNVNDVYQIIRPDWTSIQYAQPEIIAYANSEFDINATISIPLSYMIDESILRIFCGSSATSRSESFIANATMIDPPSTPLVIRCCTGEAMDPMGFITCNRTSPNETYVYFPLLSKVDMYSVYFDKEILRTDCPGDDPLFVSPNSRIKFERYNESTEYSFSIRSINCNDQISQYSNFTLFPAHNSPRSGDVIKKAIYNDDFTLAEIQAIWNISDLECSIVEYTYNAVLQNGSADDIDFAQVKCTKTMECSANFHISSSYLLYRIFIVAVDNQGVTVGLPYTSELIDGLIQNVSERLSVSFSRCFTSAYCRSSLDGSCIIHISQNSSIEESEILAMGSVNSSIDISGLVSNRIYYYRAVFSIGQTIQIKGNFTTLQYIKDNRAVIGAGAAAFIFGFILYALGCIVAFTTRFFKSCPCQIMAKDDYRCCWIATLVYSVVIILLFITLLILWIIVSTTAHSDSCPTGQPSLEIIAMSLSFVLVVLSTIMLAIFILLILLKEKNKPEYSYELQEKEYCFEYGTKEVIGNKDRTCVNCGMVTGISLIKDHFCETCGKRLCIECCYGKIFIYHKLDYGFACRDCKAKYWKENSQFSHNDPVSVISSNIGEKHTGVCTACKQDFQGIKICCKSCGNDVCDREKCHCKKIPLKVAKEEKEINNDGEELVTEEETVVCSICYMLYQRIQHKNGIEKHENIII